MAAHHYDSATRYSYTGTIERRAPKNESGSFKGTRFEGIVPAEDGHIAPTMQRGRPTAPFHEYVTLLGYPELDDTPFADRQLIAEHREELDEVLLPLLKRWKKAEYFNTFMSEGFVAGVVQTSEDLANCPQLEERGYFAEIEHPCDGTPSRARRDVSAARMPLDFAPSPRPCWASTTKKSTARSWASPKQTS